MKKLFKRLKWYLRSSPRCRLCNKPLHSPQAIKRGIGAGCSKAEQSAYPDAVKAAQTMFKLGAGNCASTGSSMTGSTGQIAAKTAESPAGGNNSSQPAGADFDDIDYKEVDKKV